MKATKLRTVEMVRRIRDRRARQLAGKTETEIIAFYRHRAELQRDWDLLQSGQPPVKIEPLR